MYVQQNGFRDLDQVFDRFLGRGAGSTIPMDAYRRGDDVWVHVDLPGIDTESLEITVERSVLTISAERRWADEEGDRSYLAERPQGVFRRQVHLGEGLDPERIEASYLDGVLTLHIPIAERAKPRRIDVAVNAPKAEAIDATSSSA